jgi:hypothetical protein
MRLTAKEEVLSIRRQIGCIGGREPDSSSIWVVYAKRPFGGPEHALRYLGTYTHRVAISNHRLIALEDGNVTFRWRDSAHGNKRRS